MILSSSKARIEDQYMFGSELLIALVLEYKTKSRKIYFPAGASRTGNLTGKIYKVGQAIDYKVMIDNIPVFSKNGFEFLFDQDLCVSPVSQCFLPFEHQ